MYLDDLIVAAKDLDSHLQKLSLVFQKLTQAGLKEKLTKCEFLKSRIEFLGHPVHGDGIHTVDSKITAVKNFPTPKSVENVRSFLGLAGYYRAFVKNLLPLPLHLHAFSRKMYLFFGMTLSNRVSVISKMCLIVQPFLRFQITHSPLPYSQTPLPQALVPVSCKLKKTNAPTCKSCADHCRVQI